ncbi:MAG: type I methionyl aminopeptidase [Enterobacteriaceae bacterium]
MNIKIKTKNEIKIIKKVGKISAKVLEKVEKYVKPGISTGEINEICHKYITKKKKARSASLGYKGFPKSICTSINNVVCHGIPKKNEIIKNGDIINIDIAVEKYGFYSDTSKMFIIGEDSNNIRKKLCRIAQESLYLAIYSIKPGLRLKNIGKIIQKFVEKNNFSVVKEYCGHGIGKKLHEDPLVFHYETYDNGIVLKPGMVFTIEPMINEGKCNVYLDKDNWTVKTVDKSLSAQYEHTVLVTKYGCEVITIRKEETIPSKIYHKI